MALRIRTKWRTGGPKTIEQRAGVVGVTIWKIAQETCRRMEKDDWPLGSDRQFVAVLTEFVAFLLQVTDRIVYGQLSEDDRRALINALGVHLARTAESNLLDYLGPGDHVNAFIATLNARAADYAECDYTDAGPSYAFLRLLGEKTADAMAATDSKWVLEQVMEIEAPEMLEPLRRVVGEVLGVKVK
ncbi:MAG TPA: hypothetical protein VGA00_05730 [Acidiferrobacterales bacterium]|jgi:hypothetical protein